MKNSKPNPKKTDIVKKLATSLEKSKAFFLTDYKGLTHKQLEDLRKALKKVEADFIITKNTLLKKSLESLNKKNIEKLYDSLKDSTATLFAYGDQLKAIKTLHDFAKNFTLPKIKIGFLDGKIATSQDFDRLAILPSKEILLSTLVYQLKSPISLLHYALSWNLQKFVIALNNIKVKKGGAK